MGGPPLKYLFVAHYADGSALNQTAEDVSRHDSKRSAFSDVDHSKLERFSLFGSEAIVTVDLRDGGFMLNEGCFRLHNVPLKQIELVYHRRHTHTFDAERKAEIAHSVVFVVGWRAVDPEGNVIERTIELD